MSVERFLAEIMSPHSWMSEAACAGIGAAGDEFFPSQGETAKHARRLCDGCPVKDPCLKYALDNHIVEGVWGGTAEYERKEMLKDLAGDRRFRSADGRCVRDHGPEFRREYKNGTRCMKCKSELTRERRAKGAA